MTIVNVALDPLAVALDAPVATVQWVATGYTLAAVIPVAAWAMGGFGAKRTVCGWRRSERARSR